jgi:hypothetical protein
MRDLSQTLIRRWTLGSFYLPKATRPLSLGSFPAFPLSPSLLAGCLTSFLYLSGGLSPRKDFLPLLGISPAPRLHLFQKKGAQAVFSLLIPALGGIYYTPAFMLSGSLVSAVTTLGRKYRTTPLAQLLSAQYARRYLVMLLRAKLDL